MSQTDGRFVNGRFQRTLPIKVWTARTEFSLFYMELCSTTLKFNRLHKIKEKIPILLHKPKKIFSSGFFNVIEHLPIYLALEARLRGPMQYKWMYPFERYYLY